MGDIPSKQSDDYIDKIPFILEENDKKVSNKQLKINKEVKIKENVDNNFKYKVIISEEKNNF